MTYHDYVVGKWLYERHPSLNGIIQAAMRKAADESDDNLEKLKGCFPEVWDDLYKRYNAPGGKLEND